MQTLAAITCLLGGVMLAVLVYGNLNYERHRRSRGAVVAGVIVDAEWQQNSVGAIYQGPVVEFVDLQGATRRFQQRSGTTFSPEIGRRVEVWYDPENPEEGPVLHEDGPTKAFPVVFGVASVGLFVVGGVLLAGSL